MLFAVTFFAYAYFYQAGGWNQNSRFDFVRAWVEEGRTAIDSHHGNTKDKAKRLGHFYCDKAPGVSWLAIPVHAAVLAVHPEEPPGPRLLAVSSWLAAVFAIGLPSALAVVFLDGLLAAWGLAPRPRAALALAYGLATITWPYSTLLYGHQLAAALLLIAFALLARLKNSPRAPAGTLFLAGFLLGVAVVAEYPAALAVLPLAAYAAVVVRPRPQVLWLILGGLLPAVALALYHWKIFGSPLALPYDFSTRKHRHLGFFMGLGVPRPEAFWHLLLSPFRGLLFSAPWLALAIPGAVRLWRLRKRAEVLTAGAVCLLFVWMNTSLVDWDGGWATGPRYLIPAIPFLVLLASGLFPRDGERPGRAQTWGFGLLAAGSAALMLAATAVKPEVPNTFRAPFGEWILPEFFAGRLAGNTQSIDSLWPVAGGPAAAWNLGQLLGLSGLASLLPLGIVILGGTVWLLQGTERRQA